MSVQSLHLSMRCEIHSMIILEQSRKLWSLPSTTYCFGFHRNNYLILKEDFAVKKAYRRLPSFNGEKKMSERE